MTKKLTKKQRLEKCLGAFLSESVGLFKILDRTGSFISSPCITPASAWASAWRYNRRQVEIVEASEAYGDGALRAIGIDVVCEGLSDPLASLSRLRELGPLAVAEIKRLGSENEALGAENKALKAASNKMEAALKKIAYGISDNAELVSIALKVLEP